MAPAPPPPPPVPEPPSWPTVVAESVPPGAPPPDEPPFAKAGGAIMKERARTGTKAELNSSPLRRGRDGRRVEVASKALRDAALFILPQSRRVVSLLMFKGKTRRSGGCRGTPPARNRHVVPRRRNMRSSRVCARRFSAMVQERHRPQEGSATAHSRADAGGRLAASAPVRRQSVRSHPASAAPQASPRRFGVTVSPRCARIRLPRYSDCAGVIRIAKRRPSNSDVLYIYNRVQDERQPAVAMVWGGGP